MLAGPKGRAVGESGELDKAVRKGERERWVLRAPLPLLAQDDPRLFYARSLTTLDHGRPIICLGLKRAPERGLHDAHVDGAACGVCVRARGRGAGAGGVRGRGRGLCGQDGGDDAAVHQCVQWAHQAGGGAMRTDTDKRNQLGQKYSRTRL
eukprot:1186272-Prorocentrum_minimum.AAC.4